MQLQGAPLNALTGEARREREPSAGFVIESRFAMSHDTTDSPDDGCRAELLTALGLDPATRGGGYFCPFCESDGRNGRPKSGSRSFSVFHRDGKWLYRCHGDCGAKGDLYDALAARGKTSRGEVLKGLGIAPSPGVPRKWRRTREAPATAIASSVPSPVPLRMDAVLRCIGSEPCYLAACRVRGISEQTMRRFGVAFFEGLTLRGRRSWSYTYSWLLPVHHEGRVVAVKVHRDLPLPGESKGAWLPTGRAGEHGLAALFPAPEVLDWHALPFSPSDWPPELQERFEREREDARLWHPWADDFEIDEIAEAKLAWHAPRSDDWIFLAPGELKSLALLSAGLPATSVTTGEGMRWTRHMVSRLEGRKVCVVFDDDAAGHEWRDETVAALRTRVPDLRTITYGRRPRDIRVVDGLILGDFGAKVDANDIARDRGYRHLRELTLRLRDDSPNLARQPFNIREHRSELKARLREALGSNGGTVWIFNSVLGAGKSRSLAKALVETGARAVVFAPSHRLAMEYEELIPGAVRLLSPRQMVKEELAPCPRLDEVNALSSRGLPRHGQAEGRQERARRHRPAQPSPARTPGDDRGPDPGHRRELPAARPALARRVQPAGLGGLLGTPGGLRGFRAGAGARGGRRLAA